MSYVLLIGADLLLAASFAIQTVYQKGMGTSLKSGLLFNALSGSFTVLVFWIINGFRFHVTGYSILMATAMGTLCAVYQIVGFRILRAGGMALYTLPLMAGGMTVPYLWGLLFLDEDFSWLRLVGLLLIIGSLILSNLDIRKAGAGLYILCVAIFFLNGFVSVVSKLHQIETATPTVSSSEFVLLTGVSRAILCGIAYFCCAGKKKPEGEPARSSAWWKILLLTVGAAVISGVSYLFQLIGAEDLPASMLYPFITGGSIVLSGITGVLLFKEKLSKAGIISIVVCFIGTLLFL